MKSLAEERERIAEGTETAGPLSVPRLRSPRRLLPAYSLLIVAACVFGAEFLVMVLMGTRRGGHGLATALLDSSVLVVLIAPSLYLFLFRPMRRQIARREAVERRLRETLEGLEGEVASRTGDLREANTALESQVALCVQHEEALRESEETYRALMNATTETAILLDPMGRILAINETGALRIGKPPRDLLGVCVYDLLSRPVADTRRAKIEDVVRTGRPVRFEDRRGDLQFDSVINPVVDPGGKVARLAVFATNTTERKRVEAEREKLIAELQDALAKVKALSGLLPICASCKKVRDDGGYWKQIEEYIRTHSEADFTHSICPDCMEKLYSHYSRP